MVRSRADIRSLSTASLQAMVFAEGAYDPGKYKHSTVGRKELETRADAMVVESRRAWNAAADSASAAMVTAAAATASASSTAAEGSGGAAAAAAAVGALRTGTTSIESKGRAAWARSLVQAWAAAVAEAATEVGEETDLQEELEAVEEHLAGVIDNASRRGIAASSVDAPLPPPRRANPSAEASSSPTPLSSAGATAPPMTLPAALEAAGSLADGFKADDNSNEIEEASDGSDNEEKAGKDTGSKHGSATVKHTKKGKKKKGKKGRLGGRNGHDNPSEPSTTSSKSYSSAAAQALVVVHRVTALQQRATRVLAHRAHPLWPRVLKVAVDASATAAAALEDQDNAARHLASTMSRSSTIDKPPVANNLDGPTPAEALLPGAPPRGEAEAMMAQFLSLNRKLVRELVRGLPGPDHPDLASTYHDLANGLKALLRRQPSAFELTVSSNAAESHANPAVAALSSGTAETDDDLSDDDMDDEPSFPPLEWASVALANQAQQRERRNHERVRALYVGR